MQYDIQPLGTGTIRLVLSGRADAAAIDAIEAALVGRLRETSGHVLVNLAGVQFMGSLGIRMLISMARLVARRGDRMAMTSVQPQVLEVFETMALFDLIPNAADDDAALALLAG
jgi:anti-anti-sigma factor